jgi:hypothetical protein
MHAAVIARRMFRHRPFHAIDRRSFLHESGLAAAWALAGPTPCAGAAAAPFAPIARPSPTCTRPLVLARTGPARTQRRWRSMLTARSRVKVTSTR